MKKAVKFRIEDKMKAINASRIKKRVKGIKIFRNLLFFFFYKVYSGREQKIYNSTH